jgi:hypothetical protein
MSPARARAVAGRVGGGKGGGWVPLCLCGARSERAAAAWPSCVSLFVPRLGGWVGKMSSCQPQSRLFCASALFVLCVLCVLCVLSMLPSDLRDSAEVRGEAAFDEDVTTALCCFPRSPKAACFWWFLGHSRLTALYWNECRHFCIRRIIRRIRGCISLSSGSFDGGGTTPPILRPGFWYSKFPALEFLIQKSGPLSDNASPASTTLSHAPTKWLPRYPRTTPMDTSAPGPVSAGKAIILSAILRLRRQHWPLSRQCSKPQLTVTLMTNTPRPR